jgi:muramoyltetrapeptide carboxypeptidase
MGVEEPIKPHVLRPGMTLGVVAPSSPVPEWPMASQGIMGLEYLGFKLAFGEHVRDAYGYLAGADAARADDFLAMFERPDVDGVICLRGGYGASRAALALDRERLRRLADGPAKPLIGYSDITVLHAMLRRELNWTTFYGPMVSSFGNPSDYTVDAFRRALMASEPFDVLPDPDNPYVETIVAGRAEGRLAGGCLSLVVSLLGTPWEIDLRDAIFFFEDVREAPYRIDRMLAQLLAAGKLRQCAGIVIGEHVDCEPDQPESTLRLEQVFADLIRPLGIPTIYHLPVGHGRHLATLPLGARAELDATNKRLRVVEPGVRA